MNGNKVAPAIEVRALCHNFTRNSQRVDVLEGLDLVVGKGEFLAIVGPSGCGKTTLLNLLSGLEPVQSGYVSVGGMSPPRPGRRDVSYVFARDALLPWRTAVENVALPLEIYGVAKSERVRRAEAGLDMLGLAGSKARYRAELSQGMRQRVALARALVTDPTLLLMDEPFAALDAQTRMTVQGQFLELWERLKLTVVLITHDLAEAVALGDRVLVMGGSPGRFRGDFTIKLARPRSVLSLQADEDFHRNYEQIWGVLRQQVDGLGK